MRLSERKGGWTRKQLQGAVQATGHRIVQLVDPEDLGILRFEGTSARPDEMDFALLWKGTWRQGRCYPSFPALTFVTYGDAERLPIRAGMLARIPEYTLAIKRLLSLASDYVHELGYLPTETNPYRTRYSHRRRRIQRILSTFLKTSQHFSILIRYAGSEHGAGAACR